MEKVKVVRASGFPVNLEDLDNFQKDMHATYDKIMKRIGVDTEKPVVMDVEVAKRSQKLLDRVERILRKKYPDKVEWNLPETSETWNELVTQHGPIMTAKDEDGSLVLVIYDIEI